MFVLEPLGIQALLDLAVGERQIDRAVRSGNASLVAGEKQILGTTIRNYLFQLLFGQDSVITTRDAQKGKALSVAKKDGK